MPYPFDHNSIGEPFIELQSVDSTNNYARSLLHEGLAEHGTAIFAHEQTAGKGRRGKAWISEKDTNIILSIVINIRPFQLFHQFELSACISVAVQEFFAKYAEGTSIESSAKEENSSVSVIKDFLKKEKIITKIKWPNDLYYGDRKAGGILIENIVSANIDDQFAMAAGRQQSITNNQHNWQWAIIGIGINVNQTDFPTSLLNPVSLKQITGQHFDSIILAKALCVIVNSYFERLVTEGFDNIHSQYLTHLYKKNEAVKLKKGNRIFNAVIKNVSSSGQLIIQHGIEEEIGFDEVEWI